MIKEFHLFAGIGGGIYGGMLLHHKCVGGVEINQHCQTVLKQRQSDGWMNEFPIYDDITTIDGKKFKEKFDVLCGGGGHAKLSAMLQEETTSLKKICGHICLNLSKILKLLLFLQKM